jgi:hypothetical protein
MLRQLNKVGARGRICGTPYRGILGSAIPSTGTHGPSAIYNDLSLPADNNKDYSLRLTAWPASGSLFMYEDGSSVFIPAANGTFTATAMLVENGVDVSSETLTYNSGSGIVVCTVGSAVASGAQASVLAGVTISANVGIATAAGAPATVTNSSATVIACGVGSAIASGALARIYQGRTIAATPGIASATGVSAGIIVGDPSRPSINRAIILSDAPINCTGSIRSTVNCTANLI